MTLSFTEWGLLCALGGFAFCFVLLWVLGYVVIAGPFEELERSQRRRLMGRRK